MEDELSNTGGASASIPPDSAALLREKDLEIEKLKKEITDLTQQLDDARAEIDDLLQVDLDERFVDEARSSVEVDEGGFSTVSANEGSIKYPKLKVRNAWDYESAMNEMPVFVVPQCETVSIPSFPTSQASDRLSCSSDEGALQLPVLRVNNNPKDSYFDENDIPHEEDEEDEEDEEQIIEKFEDVCKEVRCIESSEPSVRSVDLNTSEAESSMVSSPVEKRANSVLTDSGNEDRVDREISMSPLPRKHKKSNSDLSDFVMQISGKSSSPTLDISSRNSLKLTRSKSWRSNSVTGLTLSPREGDEKSSDVFGKPGSIQRKFCAFKFGYEGKSLSREASPKSSNTGAGEEHKTQNLITPVEKPFADHLVQISESELEHAGKEETVIDACLDAIEDGVGSLNVQVSDLEQERADREKTVTDACLDPTEDDVGSHEVQVSEPEEERAGKKETETDDCLDPIEENVGSHEVQVSEPEQECDGRKKTVTDSCLDPIENDVGSHEVPVSEPKQERSLSGRKKAVTDACLDPIEDDVGSHKVQVSEPKQERSRSIGKKAVTDASMDPTEDDGGSHKHKVQLSKPKQERSGSRKKTAIEDDVGSHSLWPSEFKRIQGEIIELWHTCNISLIHRTYFFLLFKGDPKDYIYMEVELKRLTFLKDSYSKQGTQTTENEEAPSLESSKKALHQERHMLSHQMRKKLSEEERVNLFHKYKIGLDSKNRRLQLAQMLWSDPRDMKHVAESAAIVAKVVGFVDQEKAFKEFFSLKYAPKKRGSKKHHHFRPIRSLMSKLHA